jgi:hypothetical protein
VETIQSVSEKSWWKHCPGVQNPADLASRGAPAQALVNSQLWWHGPEWLIEEEEDWPDSTQDKQDPSIQENIDAESRGAVVNITAAVAIPTEPIDWDLDVVSTWNRFLRSRTWMLRFSNRSRKRLRDPGAGLTEAIKVKDKVIRVARFASEELDEAELTIYRQLQKEKYPKAYETLQLGLPIHQKEKIASLNPVWDERDKLIRISGRVILALRDKNIEPPILLPANHKIVSFIIADKHESLHHAGVKTTLSELKERFWIVRGRQQTKKELFKCVKCKKLSSPPFNELAAPLPLNRLKNPQAFNVTGVDFAGPLYHKLLTIKKTKKKENSVEADSIPEPLAAEEAPQEQEPEPLTEAEAPIDQEFEEATVTNHRKCYVCLFTCAVTRAVHLELVVDLSARSFLLAFRRFAARRGPVSVMYSDNAQTFRCVERHLNILQADPTGPRFTRQKKTSLDLFRQFSPMVGRILGADGAERQRFITTLQRQSLSSLR